MKNSPYMTWAKYHAAARYNLANSGILGCDTSDLDLSSSDILVNGPNTEGYAPLKEAIAECYGVAPDNVVTAQGTSMANFLTMATILERGDQVLIEQPAYDPFLSAASYLGAEIHRFSRKLENGFRLDLDEIKGRISARTKLIVISNPHNPSGVDIDQESIAAIGEMAARVGAYVLVDEVYRDILFEAARPVAFHLGEPFITTSSLTKAYGLSGLRCGWVLCRPDLAERMRRLNDIFGAVGSMPGESLGVAAFRQLERLRTRTRNILGPNQELVRGFLARNEEYLDYHLPQHTMIVFPRLRHLPDSGSLHDLLREYQTSIVPGRFFEEPQHFRLGFAVRSEDVAAGLGFLAEALVRLHQK